MTSISHPFTAPAAPGSGIKWDTLAGSLLLVEPLGVEANISTAYGSSEAVRATVTVLDGTHKGDTFRDSLIFPKVLQGQLRGQVGQKVLGRLATGKAKPGQSAPWQLNEATDADVKVGLAHLSNGDKPPY